MKRGAMLAAVLMLGLSGCSSITPAGSQQAKTREQAKSELLQAWQDGWLPHRDAEYPPTQAILKRNQQRYARQHTADASDAASASKASD
ncbi:hypothetical protein AWB71_05541 [Caballeronia peredens]|nr:hypothetical protein AWB71_05541 [Caballeronia peredens]